MFIYFKFKMEKGFIVMILANIFNITDLVTTIYAVNVLGFKEINVYVDMILRSNLLLYVAFKIGSLIALSFVYVLSLRSRHPFVIGVNRGCVISFCMMCFVLGLASVLNACQILFGENVTPVLLYVAKIIPTLKVI